MPDIITLIALAAYILAIIVIYQIYKGISVIKREQEKQTRILFTISRKHGVSDSELESIDRMHDSLMW